MISIDRLFMVRTNRTIHSVWRGEGPLYLLREQRGVVVYGFQENYPLCEERRETTVSIKRAERSGCSWVSIEPSTLCGEERDHCIY
jgi:hypothetical protein